MTRGRGDLRNDHLVDVRAACLDAFRFDPGASQQFGNLFRTFWKIDKFAQPVNGKFHFFAQSFRAKSRNPAALPECNATGCLGFARHDETLFTRTVSKSAGHSARRAGYQEFRTESSPADPCRARMHSRSTFRDRRRYRHALC